MVKAGSETYGLLHKSMQLDESSDRYDQSHQSRHDVPISPTVLLSHSQVIRPASSFKSTEVYEDIGSVIDTHRTTYAKLW